MKIQNPNYADPVRAYVAAKKNAIQTWLASLPTDKQFITPAEIRAQFPGEAAKLTDGTIAEICKVIGLAVIEGA